MKPEYAIATLTLPTSGLTGGPASGRMGICPLPGLHGDLAGDLKAIIEWAPALVLTLTEQTEMDACGITLSDSTGIDWVHLPIADFGTPEGQSLARWPGLSKTIHRTLAGGGSVLFHCRGGKGRSGMMALRILVESGEIPHQALARLRRVRPGAVETEQQLAWATAGKPAKLAKSHP